MSAPPLRLGHGPTPVRSLPGLGPDIWVKDESSYGDGAWGGNKIRKLEWTLADAQAQGRKTVLTFGGLGTNHGLATALYARDAGLRCALALVEQPRDTHVEAQLERLRGSGATLHFFASKPRVVAALPYLLAHHRRPYVLPAGGSSPVGVRGWIEGARELAGQVRAGELPEPAWVVCAVGTGGTVAGLAAGLRAEGMRTRVLGVIVNDKLPLDARRATRLARRAATLARTPAPEEDDVRMTRDFLGAGYGHPTAAAGRAANRAAEEGLALDPVYTAKAMAGLLALRARGELAGPVVFLQTDGPR